MKKTVGVGRRGFIGGLIALGGLPSIFPFSLKAKTTPSVEVDKPPKMTATPVTKETILLEVQNKGERVKRFWMMSPEAQKFMRFVALYAPEAIEQMSDDDSYWRPEVPNAYRKLRGLSGPEGEFFPFIETNNWGSNYKRIVLARVPDYVLREGLDRAVYPNLTFTKPNTDREPRPQSMS
ncbi:MAG: hypothetical protein WCW14_02860 [Candidatus Paceibacterota bacterium]|jgi:hypothetical protein